MKRVLVVFLYLLSTLIFAQEVKTQKDILQIPNTDLVKDFNLKNGNSNIKPINVTKISLLDIGFGFKNTSFQYLKNEYLAVEINFENNKLIKHRQYTNFSGFKTEATSFYTYNSNGKLAKREFEQKKGEGTQTTTYTYKNNKILKIRDFGTLGNGKTFDNVKSFINNFNYLSYEINDKTITYQIKNGLILKVQTLNNKTSTSIITRYKYNSDNFLTEIANGSNITLYDLNKNNVIKKETNKTYHKHYKYVYDKYGNWIIAYQLSTTDKDYNGNKTKTKLYGQNRVSFSIREIKYSNGEVTGSKNIEDGKTKNIVINLRNELYDELINGKSNNNVRKGLQKEIFSLPKTDLVEDYNIKVGARNSIPKLINEKQFDQRRKRASTEISTILEREKTWDFDVKNKRINNYSVIYKNKKTTENYSYDIKGNLKTYDYNSPSFSHKKTFSYNSNGNFSYIQQYTNDSKGTKHSFEKTAFGYFSKGTINKKIILKNNSVEKIIYNYDREDPSEDILKYNNKGQVIKNTGSIYTTTYTYNSNGDIETHLEESNNTNSFTKRSYTYKYDKYGNWIISLLSLDNHFILNGSLPNIPNPTLRKITYSNGNVTGTTDINKVKNELISLRKKAKKLNKKPVNQVVTWKKISKTNFNFHSSNKENIKATNRFMGNHLLLFDVDDQQLFLLENFATAPLNKLTTAKKINVDTKNGYWFKLSKDGGVAVFTSEGKFIEKSSIYKYANNQIDVIFKGENETDQVVLKNYKNVKPLEVLPVFSFDSYKETKITTNTKSNSKCLKGDCENGYGEEEYESGDFNEGFFENGKPNGPIHTLYKENNASVFTLYNGTYNKSEGFNYLYDGKKISSYTNLSKNIGFINNYTTKKTYQLNIENGKVISKTELRYNNSKTCVVGNCTNGTGIYEYNNSTYMGTFKNGKRDGVGTIYFKNGSQYIGEFYNNEYHGLGTYIKTKTDYYLGMYKNGKYHGKGVRYYSKDNYKAGVWENGNLGGKTQKKTVSNNNNNNNNNSTSSVNISDTDKNEIQKCAENRDCLVNYFFNLNYNNKQNSNIKNRIRSNYLYLYKMNPKLAYNTIMIIDSEVLNAINIKSLPNDVQTDLRKRAQGIMDGYKKHMKKQGY